MAIDFFPTPVAADAVLARSGDDLLMACWDEMFPFNADFLELIKHMESHCTHSAGTRFGWDCTQIIPNVLASRMECGKRKCTVEG